MTAQLVDKNGNKESIKDESIQINCLGMHDGIVVTGGVKETSTASKIFRGETDANGQVHATLTSAQVTELIGMTAEPTTKGKGYYVQLNIGGKNVNEADLYWASANLLYKNDVTDEKGDWYRTKDAAPTSEVAKGVIKPTVTDNWKYGVLAYATDYEEKQQIDRQKGHTDWTYGKLAEYDEIRIEGLKIKMTPEANNKGQYTDSNNGEVTATSTKAGNDTVTATIDSSSVSEDVTFKAIKKLADGTEEVTTYNCVGEGTPILKAQMKLNIGWQAKEGTILSWYSPFAETNGSMASGTKTIYVKLTDATGENPVADGEKVTISAGTDVVLVGSPAYNSLLPYRTAKTNYENADKSGGVYAAALDALDSAVTALTSAASTDLENSPAYPEIEAKLNAAVQAYKDAISTYTQAIVDAKTTNPSVYATATSDYETAKADFYAAAYTFNKAITDALGDGAASATYVTGNAFETFIKAAVAPNDGTITVTKTSSTLAVSNIKWTKAVGYDLTYSAGEKTGTDEEIPAGWYVTSQLSAAKTATTGKLTDITTPAIANLASIDGLSVTGTPANGDGVVIHAFALDSSAGGDVKDFVDVADTYIGLAKAYSSAIANWSINSVNNKREKVTVTNGYVSVEVEVDPKLNQPSTIITATPETFSGYPENFIINWNNGTPLTTEEKDGSTVVKLNNSKSITIPFNNELDASAEKKELFVVTEDGHEKEIDTVSVKGKELTINFKLDIVSGSTIQVKAKPYTDDKTGIVYNLTDVNGYSVAGEKELVSSYIVR